MWYRGNPIIPTLRYGPNREFESAWGWLADISRIIELNKHHREGFQHMCDPEGVQKFVTYGPTCFHSDLFDFVATENAGTVAIDEHPMRGGCRGQVVSIIEEPNSIGVIARSLFEYLDFISESRTVRL